MGRAHHGLSRTEQGLTADSVDLIFNVQAERSYRQLASDSSVRHTVGMSGDTIQTAIIRLVSRLPGASFGFHLR